MNNDTTPPASTLPALFAHLHGLDLAQLLALHSDGFLCLNAAVAATEPPG